MWLLYLVGCSYAFKNGGARLYQVLVEKQARKEESGMPLTREHLYGKRSQPNADQQRAA
jgi:cyclopropane-fatty-acyl-phospholipid synthase